MERGSPAQVSLLVRPVVTWHDGLHWLAVGPHLLCQSSFYASSAKRNVTVWRPSVCLSRWHTHRDSPGGSMRRVQCTFRPWIFPHERNRYLLLPVPSLIFCHHSAMQTKPANDQLQEHVMYCCVVSYTYMYTYTAGVCTSGWHGHVYIGRVSTRHNSTPARPVQQSRAGAKCQR